MKQSCAPLAVLCLLLWSGKGAHGTTEYNDNLQPILHIHTRNEIVNNNRDYHQSRLLVNKAKLYTETTPPPPAPPTFSTAERTLPPGISEDLLFHNIDLSSFVQGYGDEMGGKIERIDEAVQTLPTIEETRSGVDQTFDHQLADLNKFNRVDNTKEIHSYTTQKKIVTVNNRNLHRYLKNLNVNTQYNTNIEKIAHSKLNNLLINNLQETHQPKLLVKYSRTDTTQDLGVRNEAPIIENERRDNRQPDIFVPAVAERIGYNGQPLPVKTEVVADETENLPLLGSDGETADMPRGKLSYSDASMEGGNGVLSTESSAKEALVNNGKASSEDKKTSRKSRKPTSSHIAAKIKMREKSRIQAKQAQELRNTVKGRSQKTKMKHAKDVKKTNL